MNLYVNGCSFTHGHRDFGGLDPMRPDSPPTWVWPSMLQPEFDKVVNQAWRGTSNNRIVRRTIDFLSTITNPTDWWVVIQWTSPERSEWFDYDNNCWYTQLYHRVVYDDMAIRDLEEQSRISRKGEIAVPYVTDIRSDEHKILDLFYQTITLDTFLKAKGFNNVLYTCMSMNCSLDHNLKNYVNQSSPNINLFNQLQGLLDEDKFLKPISVVTAGNEESAEDGHPNIEGHRIFSRYILNEMEKRA